MNIADGTTGRLSYAMKLPQTNWEANVSPGFTGETDRKAGRLANPVAAVQP